MRVLSLLLSFLTLASVVHADTWRLSDLRAGILPDPARPVYWEGPVAADPAVSRGERSVCLPIQPVELGCSLSPVFSSA